MHKTKTVLIVEDDRFLANAYEQAFLSFKIDSAILYDGSEVLEYCIKKQPSIVLLDILLPVKDGFTILEELQAHKETKNIPVVIASNLGQSEEIEKAKKLGAKDYIVKSETSLSEILEIVKEHI